MGGVISAITSFVSTVINTTLGTAFLYICFAAGIGLYQERKLWIHNVDLKPIGHAKIYFSTLVNMLMTVIGIIGLTPSFLQKDPRVPRWCNQILEFQVANILFHFFCGQVEIVGLENLPDEDTACVYIFNHQSQLDTAPAYMLKRYCTWVAKSSVSFVPGLGQAMHYGKHILLNRSGADSVKQFKDKAHHRLTNEKRNVFLFPAGTRSRTHIMPFKNGAFTIALNSNAPIVPCTIEYTDDVWTGAFNRKDVVCTITVHPRVEVDPETDTVEELREKCYKIVNAPFFGKLPEKPYVKSSSKPADDKKAD